MIAQQSLHKVTSKFSVPLQLPELCSPCSSSSFPPQKHLWRCSDRAGSGSSWHKKPPSQTKCGCTYCMVTKLDHSFRTVKKSIVCSFLPRSLWLFKALWCLMYGPRRHLETWARLSSSSFFLCMSCRVIPTVVLDVLDSSSSLTELSQEAQLLGSHVLMPAQKFLVQLALSIFINDNNVQNFSCAWHAMTVIIPQWLSRVAQIVRNAHNWNFLTLLRTCERMGTHGLYN